MSKTFDFDDWYDENAAPEKPTRPFRVAGRLWQIPVDVPAAALLRMETMRRRLDELDGRDQTVPLPDAEAAEVQAVVAAAQPAAVLRAMIGDQLVDSWIAAGLSERRLLVVAGVLYRHYTGEQTLDDLDRAAQAADEDAEGKAPTPPVEAGTSSTGSSITGP